MSLLRKFFYKKPPEGLLEISERVFVFDRCFSTDVLEQDDYKTYMEGIVGKLCEHFHDATFMVFNFKEGESQSQLEIILNDYEMTVINYPRQYENCPVLTMEMIHHFVKSIESWLSIGITNVLLMHCERGGWPVLAFMLAAFLIYRKQFNGEHKTLDMIYKQAPRELLHLMSPLNPLPSQLRYLKYVSRRKVEFEWPPLDRALTLDCVILRVIPNIDAKGGCRPIFRIYGRDPFMAADRTPKVLFSTAKMSKSVRHHKQENTQLVKIDIHCHILGDVVLECITLDDDLEREEMMFRVMFNTAFIKSNVLMLNRDEIDVLWNVKDQFPKDFRAEILFSEMDSYGSSNLEPALPSTEENEGLPVEAFATCQEYFSDVDWRDPGINLTLNSFQMKAANILQEKMESLSPLDEGKEKLIKSTFQFLKNEKMELAERRETVEDNIAGVDLPGSPDGLLPPKPPPLAPPPPPPPSSELKSITPPPPPPPPCLESKPIPPPPPPCIESKSIPTATAAARSPSSATPPVPPPPVPLSSGISKANGVSLQSNSDVNRSIPPPPFGAKGKLPSRSSLRNPNQSKRTPLKPYHWLKLTRVMHGSLWAETQKPEEASQAPEFNMSELETLFSANVPNSGHRSGGGKSGRAAGTKSDKVQLIDLRRAYNCEIMLTKVKIPLPDLMSSVLALDDSALDSDQVDNLIKFCPTKEEMELLKNYKGEKENLGKCEQFFLELMKVPRVESKLRVFSFKIQFSTQVSDLRNSLNIVNSASEEVRSSAKFRRIMQTILSLGNALNQGTARGSAVGFRLDSLLKLTDTRSRNNKMTLMHYLCKVLAEKLPELLNFSKDLANLEAATKIQLKYLAEEMQAITKGLEKVIQELAASESDGLVSESFSVNLKGFFNYAEKEVKSVSALYSEVGRNCDALPIYFGEDPARCPFEQAISTLVNFVRTFNKAHEENCKQLEFERKKALKEAENEKAQQVRAAGMV